MKKIAALIVASALGLTYIGYAVHQMGCDYGVAYAQPALDAAPAPSPDPAVVRGPDTAKLPPLPEPGDEVGFALASYKWITSGNGFLAVVPILILLSWLAMHPKTWPLSKWSGFQKFIESRRGKVAVVAGVALLGAIAHALAATGRLPELAVLKKILPEVLAAMGGYEGIRIAIKG